MDTSCDPCEPTLAELKLRRALQNGSVSERVSAIHQFSSTAGPRAIEPLLEALNDPMFEVRTAAVTQLGRLHDAAALAPLLQSFGECCRPIERGSPKRIGLTLVSLLLIPGIVWGANVGLAVVMFLCAVGFLWITSLLSAPTTASLEATRLHGALGLALAELAEHDPRPELMYLVAPLREMSADPVTKDSYTRDSFRRAADRIEAATIRSRDLPIVAIPPAAKEGTLPRAAQPAELIAKALPRVGI